MLRLLERNNIWHLINHLQITVGFIALQVESFKTKMPLILFKRD